VFAEESFAVFCVFCPNPQKFLPQKAAKSSKIDEPQMFYQFSQRIYLFL